MEKGKLSWLSGKPTKIYQQGGSCISINAARIVYIAYNSDTKNKLVKMDSAFVLLSNQWNIGTSTDKHTL